MDPLVSMRGVAKCYGEQRVLSVEACDMAEGDRVLVQGANGSGKSTFLRLLAGIATPTRGRVDRLERLAAAPLGYVPQRGGLYMHMTARENLARRRRLFGLAPGVDADGIPAELRLEPFLDRRVDRLSGGIQRLVAVAASLVVEPAWLAWDEPFAGVDPENVERVRVCLEARRRTLSLVVMTAPDAAGAQEGWTRVVTLESGVEPCREP